MDNLKIYEDGHGFCFKCNHYKHANGEKVTEKKSSLSVSQVLTYPLAGDPDRRISGKTIEFYGVRASCDEGTGKVDTVYYPYYEKSTLTGFKPRRLPKEFRPLVGNAPKQLFGQQVAKPDNKRPLLVVEGEEDALAAKEMLVNNGIHCDVVSLPNGSNTSGKVDPVMQSQLPFLQKYNRIYLFLDDDEAGKTQAVAIGDWLANVCQVRLIDMAGIAKDASEAYVSGKDADFITAYKDARVYEPEGVVSGIDIPLADLLTAMTEGYPFPYDGLNEKLHGARKGEILTLCAGSGIGKTTLVREITKGLIDQGLSVANVALEDQMNVTAQALIALDMDIPLATFRFNPPTEAQAKASYEKMVANGRTYFYKHFGGLTADSLMNKLYYYARSKAVDFIILDHLSMVISSTDSMNERKDIDTLMTNLAKMVVETGVGLIQIVHLKRPAGDRSYAHGGEIELSDLRGSAALEQLSWAVVGMERDQQGDDRDFSRLRVLKNRTFGFTGLCDHLKYDPITGRIKNVVDVPEMSEWVDEWDHEDNE